MPNRTEEEKKEVKRAIIENCSATGKSSKYWDLSAGGDSQKTLVSSEQRFKRAQDILEELVFGVTLRQTVKPK